MEVKVITIPLYAGSVNSCDIPLGTILFTQFGHEITGWETREKIWPSVNYLFFISTTVIYGKNWQVRQYIVWLKDLKGVLGAAMSKHGSAWLKL